MKPVKTDINVLIESCVNFFSGHEQVKFHSEIDGRIPEIYIDKNLIKQTLNNLIQNAIDAVGKTGNIYITSRLLTGEGVDTAQDNHTRRRRRASWSATRRRSLIPGFSTKSTGTGLGLAIVEKIIMEHKGEISCNSEYGKGTEFVIDLPIDKLRDMTNG